MRLFTFLYSAGAIYLSVSATLAVSSAPQKTSIITQEFKNYWYTGKAEITSYTLKKSRYAQLHEGTAVLIYVTEPFLPNIQVKADNDQPENVSVLKLNTTKNFLTGIYPYSIITSTFFPITPTIAHNNHAIKVSASTQEWCGHTYTQINNRDQFTVMAHSYFEGEADQQTTLPKTHLENEIWTKIRLDPNSLPIGNIKVIPSLEFTRLRHIPIQAYDATATLSNNPKNSDTDTRTYSLIYPTLERTLEIDFNAHFPFEILGWRDTHKSGFGDNVKTLTSIAIKNKTIKSDYWNKHNNKDRALRKQLGL